jgi:hypothetical protein
MRRLYITNFAGLGNRLEALTLARALQESYGGEILLDWPELDALRVPFARFGRLPLFDRWRSRRVRNCDEAQFAALREESSILLRGLHGPPDRMRGLYLRAMSALRLRRDLKDAVERMFQSVGARPVVGVHLRRGDFSAASGAYDTTAPGSEPALPMDWVEAAMRRCLEFWRDCVFFVSATGPEEDYARLGSNFDLFQVPVKNPYAAKWEGHGAPAHPVADLFALACCEVVVATPLSSFSHVACNALGPPAICLVPPQRMQAGETTLCRLDMHGQLLADWVRAFRESMASSPLTSDIVQERGWPRALTDWIPVFDP